MKTAEEVALTCCPCFTSNPELGPSVCGEGGKADAVCEMHFFIAQALSAYAEEASLNTKSIMNMMIRKARAEALEEAAKVAESIYGTRFHDKTEVRTGKKIARNIRALKEKP